MEILQAFHASQRRRHPPLDWVHGRLSFVLFGASEGEDGADVGTGDEGRDVGDDESDGPDDAAGEDGADCPLSRTRRPHVRTSLALFETMPSTYPYSTSTRSDIRGFPTLFHQLLGRDRPPPFLQRPEGLPHLLTNRHALA